ncbi:MAG: tRNA uridine-5-carboxymethylaminomethyl(34) synthesis GTPase MnmE [Clostridia bacterium]|nr:tRNA uridine-5-carboxymethylaminomethyl(34) synthesis GTPase MnmE [Clostridia bacterium]MBO4884682.1 tRNA uridine-5-carboxymethylaminomethyl(34) synthesis GTPase MnmE [Clostridia bacterium]
MSTVAAIATARGEGGIAIVRVSGAEAERILRSAFRRAGRKNRDYESHRLYFGHAVDARGGVIDEAMAVLMRAPRSYTREDVAEIHCHGGFAAADRVLRRVLELGAEPAAPGEFTRRAFENGRIDLSRAEAVMSVISAGSEAALRASVRELEGGVSQFIGECRKALTDLLALIEASNDFPDEIDEPAAARKVACEARSIAGRLLARVDEKAARIVREGVSVVLAGRPNVGKSSLLNALTGTERAIVTDIPGTTRDVLTESVNLDGIRVSLSDTAGQRDAADAVEMIGVERARAAQKYADIVLIVLDGSEALTEEDKSLLKQRDGRCIVVLNKDDLNAAEAVQADIRVSARTGEGIAALASMIREKAGAAALHEGLLTQERHIACAKAAAEALQRAVQAIEGGAPLDMASVDLWEARRRLGEITGEDAAKSVIDAVFANFCVGK